MFSKFTDVCLNYMEGKDSMKSDKQNELLKILRDSSQSVPTASLSKMLGVSERTVRSYVKELNDTGNYSIISDPHGYQLSSSSKSSEKKSDEAENRVYRVLSDLLVSKEALMYLMRQMNWQSALVRSSTLFCPASRK